MFVPFLNCYPINVNFRALSTCNQLIYVNVLHMSLLQFTDASTTRWEPPIPIYGTGSSKPDDAKYLVEITEEPVFSLRVIRQATGAVM